MRPRSLVVMGGKWAEAVITSSVQMGFDGAIWPVHPSKDEICGYKTYASLAELPLPPDAVFLGINRHATIAVVAELALMGAGGVVAFASGFAEVDDGHDLQAELVAAAGDMPVLGPNCYGLINYLDGALLWPDAHGGIRVDKGVAIITQSSNLSVNLTMQDGGLPIAYMMTLGNQAMIRMADLINAVAEDDRVTAIGLHIEGIHDALAFAKAAQFAKNSGKPLVAIKAGASDAAQKMTFSHTASLAGGHAVSTAFLERLGVGVVDSIDGFLQALGLLHLFGSLQDPNILTLSCSGGEASLIADAAKRHGIAMPILSPSATAEIKKTVNPLVTVSNPFDYHTFDWGDKSRLTATFTAVMTAAKEQRSVCILILDFPAAHLGRGDDWFLALDAWHDGMRRTGANTAVLSSLPECLPKAVTAWLMERGIMPMRGFDAALAGLAAAHQALTHKKAGFIPSGLKPLNDDRIIMAEGAAKSALAEFGVTVPGGVMANTIDDALNAARGYFAAGRKAVMKIDGVAHKTEKDGVILGVDSDDAVRTAWARLNPHGSVLVEAMVEDGVAEVIIGVARDPVVGLHMVIGSGGIMAELMDDASVMMIPFSRDDVAPVLAGSMAAAVIDGFRGKPKGDKDALIDLVMAVQDYVLAHEHLIDELDLNPVIVCPQGQGVVAVDALIRHAKNKLS